MAVDSQTQDAVGLIQSFMDTEFTDEELVSAIKSQSEAAALRTLGFAIMDDLLRKQTDSGTRALLLDSLSKQLEVICHPLKGLDAVDGSFKSSLQTVFFDQLMVCLLDIATPGGDCDEPAIKLKALSVTALPYNHGATCYDCAPKYHLAVLSPLGCAPKYHLAVLPNTTWL